MFRYGFTDEGHAKKAPLRTQKTHTCGQGQAQGAYQASRRCLAGSIPRFCVLAFAK